MAGMKYLPWIIAAICFGAGWIGFAWLIVPALAVVTTFLVFNLRKAQLASEKHRAGPPNMVVEGLYLYVLQVLVLGLAYLVGYFLANAVPI